MSDSIVNNVNNVKSKNIFSKDKFRWGFSSLGCPDLTLNEIMDLAFEFKLGFIELRTISSKVNIVQELSDFIEKNPDKMEFIRENNFVYSINSSFTLCNSKVKDYLEIIKLAELADKFNCKYLRVFGGFDFCDEFTDELLQESLATINMFNQFKEKYGIKCELTLEIHDGYSSSDRVMKLINAYGGFIPIIWDAHHSYQFAEEDFEYSWNLLKDYIVHIHIKDSIVVDRAKKKFKTVLPGDGDVPSENVIKLLRESGYDKCVSLEWEKFWEKEIPTLDIAIKKMITENWV